MNIISIIIDWIDPFFLRKKKIIKMDLFIYIS